MTNLSNASRKQKTESEELRALRIEYLRRLEARTCGAAFQEAERARCASDIVYWVNTYCKTFDPREEGGVLPFHLFPRQGDFLQWLKDRETAQEDGLAEKCRDVGFTWLCVVYVVHGWLYRRGFAAGFGSRKRDLVDKMGDMDSILEKVRFTLRWLPAWMLPQGYKERDHAAFCNIKNPENGNSVTGEGGDNIGRGGRKTIYIVDEHAFLVHPKKVEAALSQTSRVKIRVSTPNGVGNEFYVKRHAGKIKVFTFRWTDDPRKNLFQIKTASGKVLMRGHGAPKTIPAGCILHYPWYAKQCEEQDAVTVAQEIDIDYTASVEGICIPNKWVTAAIDLPIKKSGYKTAGFDVAAGGKNKNVLVIREGPVVPEILDWADMTTTASAWKLVDECDNRGVRAVHYDGSGIGITLEGTWQDAKRTIHVHRHAVLGGESPSDEMWPNGKCATELFGNHRAELYWKVRTRFMKAFEFKLFIQGLPGGAWHPDDEMISIPNHPDLISQLSMPLVIPQSSGKILIESKKDMRKRGVKSPDFADALIYSEDDWADWGAALQATTASNQRRKQSTPEVW